MRSTSPVRPGPHRRPKYRVIQRVRVESLGELWHVVGSLHSWCVYRGQGSWKWRLQPTLERAGPSSRWRAIELAELAAGQKATRGADRPAAGDHLGWLSRLRHSRRPVRLLDFTRNLNTALYFALDQCREEHPAIWAIDGIRMEAAWRVVGVPPTETVYMTSPTGNSDEFNALYGAAPGRLAAMLVEPQHPNRKQALQESIFLVGLDHGASLEECLFGGLSYGPEEIDPVRDEDGRLRSPIGFSRMPLRDTARAQLKDALFVQILVHIDPAEIRRYLDDKGVTAESLGF